MEANQAHLPNWTSVFIGTVKADKNSYTVTYYTLILAKKQKVKYTGQHDSPLQYCS